MDTVKLRTPGVAGAAVAGLLLAPQAAAHSPGGLPHAPGAPHYDHVFVVVEGNHGYGDRQAVGAPDPGTGDTVPGGVTGAGGELWAVGVAAGDNGRIPLVEHHAAGWPGSPVRWSGRGAVLTAAPCPAVRS